MPSVFLAGRDVDDDDMLGTDLFETEAMGLHENLVLPRHSHRDMAEDVIPVAFVGEDVARVSEIFFELFDIDGHFHSLAEIVEIEAEESQTYLSVFVSAQAESLNLTCHGFRQVVDKLYPARIFVGL